MTAYLQMLERQFAEQPADEARRVNIERALQQVRQLGRLVQDLLDVRRLQYGSFNLDLAPVALEALAAQAVETAQVIAPPEQAIVLETPDGPLTVSGDADRIRQILLNLLTNAITYAPGSPRIVVRLRRAGNEAELQVRDEGAGIAAAELSRIFGRFYQVRRTDDARPSRRGMGLGLYIVHELVAAHGGRIEVVSVLAPDPDHGTTFTIHLPLIPGAEGARGQQSSQRTPRQGPSDDGAEAHDPKASNGPKERRRGSRA